MCELAENRRGKKRGRRSGVSSDDKRQCLNNVKTPIDTQIKKKTPIERKESSSSSSSESESEEEDKTKSAPSIKDPVLVAPTKSINAAAKGAAKSSSSSSSSSESESEEEEVPKVGKKQEDSRVAIQ